MEYASREVGGGGVLSMVFKGIGHASFSDAELLFGNLVPQTVLSVSCLIKTPTPPPFYCGQLLVLDVLPSETRARMQTVMHDGTGLVHILTCLQELKRPFC